MDELSTISGSIAGKILSIPFSTRIYHEAANITNVDFEDVANSVEAKRKGSSIIVRFKIGKDWIILHYRKGRVMLDTEVWDIHKMEEIIQMIIFVKNKVDHKFTLIASSV